MPDKAPSSQTNKSAASVPSIARTNSPDKIRPFDAVMLDVGDGHWIYVEEVGIKQGVPAIFLHGGPGSGSQHLHRNLFDPTRNHAILFDQRGAGRSHPYLDRNNNTTAHLVADIEKIREFYAVEKWIVTGGSWGSTLALAYAETHPERVAALFLRAVFLGTRNEVEWAFIEGPKRFRPELYRAFINALPEDERADPLNAYLLRINNPDPKVHAPAANVWNTYERALSVLQPGQVEMPTLKNKPSRLPPTPLMEAHYIVNDFFFREDELLKGAERLNGIPGTIIQGRYDLLCPPTAAYAIADRWGTCRLQFVDNAGHAITEANVFDLLRQEIAQGTAELTAARRS
ncbi:MAG: prolyl aminopeptidase [Filomicrobium sp.]